MVRGFRNPLRSFLPGGGLVEAMPRLIHDGFAMVLVVFGHVLAILCKW